MLVLSYQKSPYLQNRIIVVLGNGFIGSSLVQRLMRYQPTLAVKFAIDWSNNKEFVQKVKEAISLILCTNDVNHIDWVWSAGSSGFASMVEETDKELRLFHSFVETIKNASLTDLAAFPFVFHLISSAGGLFEGVVNVSKTTCPIPKRPYGQLKLAQENMALDFFQEQTRIYRLSSVFGNSGINQRKGIITVLLRNALSCQMSNIYGSFDTKRDYVWVDDLSRFIVNKIVLNNKSEESVFLLASGKASSIFEIIEIVKKITNSKLMFKLDFVAENNQPIVFLPSVLPEKWESTSIETAMRIVYNQILVSNNSR